MLKMRTLCLVLFIFVESVPFVRSYPEFRSKIPNGEHVTNPCQDGGLWEGVGHKSRGGKGPLNPFGEDFKKSKFNWTAVCQLDSDKDGQTNGRELGDPNCTWTEGSSLPLSRDNVTHPGICEPIDSENCTDINKWLQCKVTEFHCNGTNEPDVQKLELRLNNTEVPAQETTYVCMAFDIPRDQSYDVIAARPIIGNKYVIHHMILFGCLEKDLKAEPGQLVPDCFMSNKIGCTSMVSAFGVWDPALDAFCLPPEVGVRIGQGGYEKLMIQYHWTNYGETSGLTDSSGLEVFYTPSLRENNSGMLLFGQMQINIPPKQENVTISGGCQPFCSAHRIRGPIKVIESFHHMHNYGRAQKIEVYRNGTKIYTLSDEKNFDYNQPTFFRYFENPVEIQSGDYLRTTCTYNSMNADKTITFGPGTSDEMCFGFIRYYPLDNLPLDEGGCSEFGTVPLCQVHTPESYTIDGCPVKSVLTFTGVNTNNTLLSDILRHCNTTEKCTTACLTVMDKMAKDPCFQNDIGAYVKYLLTYWRRWDGMRIMQDLLRTKCSNDEGNAGSTVGVPGTNRGSGSLNQLVYSHMTLVAILISCALMING